MKKMILILINIFCLYGFSSEPETSVNVQQLETQLGVQIVASKVGFAYVPKGVLFEASVGRSFAYYPNHEKPPGWGRDLADSLLITGTEIPFIEVWRNGSLGYDTLEKIDPSKPLTLQEVDPSAYLEYWIEPTGIKFGRYPFHFGFMNGKGSGDAAKWEINLAGPTGFSGAMLGDPNSRWRNSNFILDKISNGELFYFDAMDVAPAFMSEMRLSEISKTQALFISAQAEQLKILIQDPVLIEAGWLRMGGLRPTVVLDDMTKITTVPDGVNISGALPKEAYASPGGEVVVRVQSGLNGPVVQSAAAALESIKKSSLYQNAEMALARKNAREQKSK